MEDLTPRREDLDPIEIASRDEIAGLPIATPDLVPDPCL